MNKVDEDTPVYFHLTEIAIPEAMCDTERCHDGGLNRLLISQVFSTHIVS